ncbi:Bgt-50692 [Blumeria graminis f. sp. tritici]|uniref:Bgt-50692 n=1 Tax=Blumeria graminis f. sp. tritici TaxID=62690 RepID=A0A9X9LC16_BLUGR|nr:Bgt-50692 [Blumeria graminis f. sp. tritici]
MELWIVDRAGAYSSGEIDVSKSQEKLIRALSSYMLMSDEDLGLDPITSYDSDGRCFVTVPNGKTSVEKIEVNPLPIARPETIASRGNTCLETKDSMYMLKFSWGTEIVESETKILKKLKGVTASSL